VRIKCVHNSGSCHVTPEALKRYRVKNRLYLNFGMKPKVGFEQRFYSYRFFLTKAQVYSLNQWLRQFSICE
jgi:hypothetical protein